MEIMMMEILVETLEEEEMVGIVEVLEEEILVMVEMEETQEGEDDWLLLLLLCAYFIYNFTNRIPKRKYINNTTKGDISGLLSSVIFPQRILRKHKRKKFQKNPTKFLTRN